MSYGLIKSGKLITDRTSYELFERNPVEAHIRYQSVLSPHGTTLRAEYTVPAGKFAILKNTVAYILVETVSTTPGLKGTYILLDIGGVHYQFCLATLGADRDAIGNDTIQMLSNEVLLKAGDRIYINTNNYSTGGTVTHLGTVLITQYDL